MSTLGTLVSISVLAIALLDDGSCGRSIHKGFDNRVAVEILGRLPNSNEAIVGFVSVSGHPVVALGHALYRFGDVTKHLPVRDEIIGIIADSNNRIWIQTRNGTGQSTQKIGPKGIKPDVVLDKQITGRLYGSGNPLLLEVVESNKFTDFIARRADGGYLPITRINGSVQKISWSAAGLALIVQDSVVIWPSGGVALKKLVSGVGFKNAFDVCQLSNGRAVVSTENMVYVVSEEGTTPLVAMKAHCAWDGNTMYLLDIRSGLVLSVRNAEHLANREQDLAYLTSLAQSSIEMYQAKAARVLGCEEVARIRKEKTPPSFGDAAKRSGMHPEP